MFPIPWNKAYRKKDGTVVNIEDVTGGGGGGSELPEYTSAAAGKVLGVTEEGTLAWVEVSGGGNFGKVAISLAGRDVTVDVKEGT